MSQTPDGSQNPHEWNRETTRLFLRYLAEFALNPVQTIRKLPNWGYGPYFILCLAASAISGLLEGILERSIWQMFAGLIVLPVLVFITVLLITLGFTYFANLFEGMHPDRERVVACVILAYLPYQLLHIFAAFLPPVDLLGFAATCLLLTVAITEHFDIPTKRAARFTASIFLAYFFVWIGAQIRSR